MAIKKFSKPQSASTRTTTKKQIERAEYEVRCKDCINRANTNGIDSLGYEDVQDIVRPFSKRPEY